ncbi:NAD(P)-dependent oxidoreductase [Gordonia sp. CPCC 206044]|uniref:NAD(P)-dependent oxidoreductase n=1 Tax=Gordonia sp. CPCC 206044 TaxID=3140793 RepID=UPI003AF38E9E
MTEVGVVGVGRMGLPMVTRLVDAGHHVRALGRSRDVRERLAAAGALPVADIADVVTASTEVVLITVLTDDQVREVCLSTPLLSYASAGTTLVIHTTGSPTTSALVAEKLSSQRVSVVDAAVSGGPHDIAAGRLTVFIGGDDRSVEKVVPTLAAYANPVVPVGELGSGQRVKLVNNAIFTAQIGLIRAGITLGEQLGLDEAALLSALPHASADSRALAGVVRRGSVDAFIGSVRQFVGKDVEVVRGVAAELDGDLGLLEPLIGLGCPPPPPVE